MHVAIYLRNYAPLPSLNDAVHLHSHVANQYVTGSYPKVHALNANAHKYLHLCGTWLHWKTCKWHMYVNLFESTRAINCRLIHASTQVTSSHDTCECNIGCLRYRMSTQRRIHRGQITPFGLTLKALLTHNNYYERCFNYY